MVTLLAGGISIGIAIFGQRWMARAPEAGASVRQAAAPVADPARLRAARPHRTGGGEQGLGRQGRGDQLLGDLVPALRARAAALDPDAGGPGRTRRAGRRHRHRSGGGRRGSSSRDIPGQLPHPDRQPGGGGARRSDSATGSRGCPSRSSSTAAGAASSAASARSRPTQLQAQLDGLLGPARTGPADRPRRSCPGVRGWPS